MSKTITYDPNWQETYKLQVLTAAEAACFGLPALAVGRGRLTEGIAPDQTPLLRCP